MKKALFLISFIFLSAISKSQSVVMDSFFHADSLRRVVELLASDSLAGRLAGSPGNKKAADFITVEFEKAGLQPMVKDSGFLVKSNVIGRLEGKTRPGEIIIFSAHYDHIGTWKTNPFREQFFDQGGYEKGDTVYNGANDDASGVAAVIALARYFASRKDNERTILFAAFNWEEAGLIGSGYFAKLFPPEKIISMINIEMIGRPRGNALIDYLPFITGHNKSNLIYLLNKQYAKADTAAARNGNYFQTDLFRESKLFKRSDNYPFARKGISAHTVMLTSDKDIYYHSLNDEAWTLDYTNMSRVVRAIALSATALVSGEDSPSRIR